MTEQEALTYAQSIWGAGEYNARVKRVSGRKFQVGRHNAKSSWILGEGSSWEEAFLAYWRRQIEWKNGYIASGNRYPDHEKAMEQYAEYERAIAEGKLPQVKR